MSGVSPQTTPLPITCPGCVGSPKLQLAVQPVATANGLIKTGAGATVPSGCSRINSNSFWANTSAVPSLRLLAFKNADAGTSCATATNPTSTTMVAIIISTSVKPRSLLESRLDMSACPTPFISDFYFFHDEQSANLLPISCTIRRPNLYRPSRKQYYRPIPWVRCIRIRQIRHGQLPRGHYGSSRIKFHISSRSNGG